MFKLAGLVAVGDEVLTGEVINSNTAWLAQQLVSVGIHIHAQIVVGDNADIIGQTLANLHDACDLVIVTGGLGPTADDITKQAIAEYYHRDIVADHETAQYILARHGRNAGWQESVARQAAVVAGSVVWQNPAGQAPGELIQEPHRVTVVLPGPPREMQAVAVRHLLPWLRASQGHEQLVRVSLSSFDRGESTLAHDLAPLLEGQHPPMGIYAKPGRVDIRFGSRANSPHDRILSERAIAWAHGHIRGTLYRLAGADRAQVIIQTLCSRGQTCSMMESLTGGLLASTLIGVPGASGCVAGGSVAYTDRIKIYNGVDPDILNQYGAVSEQCAMQMALAIREHYSTDWGVSTTGYAGPGGGDANNPVGTFFTAVAGPTGVQGRRRTIHVDRLGVREAAVELALTQLWEMLELPKTWPLKN